MSGQPGSYTLARTTRDNNPFAGTQRRARCVARLYVRVHAKLTHTPRDQVRVLATRVEDSNLRMDRLRS